MSAELVSCFWSWTRQGLPWVPDVLSFIMLPDIVVAGRVKGSSITST